MGTWSVPYSSPEKARRFKRRMQKPWITKVKLVDGYYATNHPDSDLLGSDRILDELGDAAAKRKKDFDIRPVVMRNLKRDLAEMAKYGEEPATPAINIVREAVGMKPLKIIPGTKKAAKAAKKHVPRKRIVVRKRLLVKTKKR